MSSKILFYQWGLLVCVCGILLSSCGMRMNSQAPEPAIADVTSSNENNSLENSSSNYGDEGAELWVLQKDRHFKMTEQNSPVIQGVVKLAKSENLFVKMDLLETDFNCERKSGSTTRSR